MSPNWQAFSVPFAHADEVDSVRNLAHFFHQIRIYDECAHNSGHYPKLRETSHERTTNYTLNRYIFGF